MVADQSGRTIVLTGASSGIGRVAAGELAKAGAQVAVVGRDPERTRSVAAAIGARAHVADFDRLDDVRRLADELLDAYPDIDVLANNAGGLVAKRALTVDGFERTLQSNHLAPYLLTRLLLPRLSETAARHGSARVISTASVANRFGQVRLDDLDWAKRPWWGGWRAYGTSKLITILFIRELAERLLPTGVDAYSFHPGFVSTGFGADSPLMKLTSLVTGGNYGITAEAGAVPLITLASEPQLAAATGAYFDGLRPNGSTARQAVDAQLGRELWNASAARVGLSRD
ncbi:SDR family NAD(P)-dependent oxidoreductase [Microbacteriaceae bacterium VKM Ac-2855]|nr:SDR family NAD(P)-dependent oxidoreductase [Microbacteriaceae bacterium VKM Ac-2855]